MLHKTLGLFFRDCELEKRREANFSAFVIYYHTGKLLQGYEPEARQLFAETLKYGKNQSLMHQLIEDMKPHLLRDLLNLNTLQEQYEVPSIIDINAKDDENSTPICLALKSKNIDCARFLLKTHLDKL